jgi:hypothetical protein
VKRAASRRRVEQVDPLSIVDRIRRVGLWALLLAVILLVLLPAVALADATRLFLLKLLVAGILAFIPGWLYLQFIRNKGESLYDEYVINLFRMHIDELGNLPAPPRHTGYYPQWKKAHTQLNPKTKDNLYRRKFEAVYGRSAVSTFEMIYDKRKFRDKTETFSPVLVATLLLCLGWVLVLQPEPFNLFGRRDLTLSGRPILPFEALQFGFLGSYLFIVLDLLARYFREDLKTAAYISSAARIVIVAVIVTGADVLWPDHLGNEQQLLSFFVGMFPEVGLQAMRAAVAKPLRTFIPSLKSEHPLSDIQGLSFWYEARLAEEGISDVQNLTSANLIDLLLRSRVPISRLIDWLDQGFLQLHVPRSPGEHRMGFQAIGIRTATDLERAWSTLQDDGAFRESLTNAFGGGLDADAAVARTKAIISSLEGEVNLRHVRAFKRGEWLDDPAAEPLPRAAAAT